MRTKFRKLICVFFLLALVIGQSLQAQVFNIVVDQHGGSDFTKVQDAINSVPNYLTTRTLIFVKSGVYNEKVVLSNTKTNVSLIGENSQKTIISWNDNPTKDGMNSADTYTFWADGGGFYAENVTFRNTSGNVGQALAIKTTGDTMVFKNCRFLGFQDTYYAHKNRQYNLKCYIEGGTDFVYGDATAVFDSCTINCVKGGSYITAPADTKIITQLVGGVFLHGLLFRNCDVTANSDVPDHSYYLGRPWQPNSSSVYFKCKLGTHIKPEGWSTWGNTDNHLSSYFAEYKDMNPDGSPADTTQRVDWSYQVSDAWASSLYNLNFFLKNGGVAWDPIPVTQELDAPQNLTLSGNQLSWEAVSGATGYIVLENDSVIGFSANNTYPDLANTSADAGYNVKSVSKSGALSAASVGLTTGSALIPAKIRGIKIISENKLLRFSEEVDFRIYSISGRLLQSGKGETANVQRLKTGIYLLKTRTAAGISEVNKVVFNH